MDNTTIAGKIKGCLFGQAVGDALGLGTEFMSKGEVARNYPGGLTEYSQIIRDRHRSRWNKGDWTDDTDMMLCIANAIIEDKGINIYTIARNFKEWASDPKSKGIGRTTANVLSLGGYENDPHRAAEIVWNLSRKNNAANGAIMRTSVIGLLKDGVRQAAEDVCMLTHYDPRCVGSCVIVSEIISHLVWWDEEMLFLQIIDLGSQYDSKIVEYIERAHNGSIEALELDDETSMGYTLKTMGAALWCLFHANSFEEGLTTVVNEGGDADTNAAVACAVLGAKFGSDAIPSSYIDGLTRKGSLLDVTDSLTNLFLDC